MLWKQNSASEIENLYAAQLRPRLRPARLCVLHVRRDALVMWKALTNSATCSHKSLNHEHFKNGQIITVKRQKFHRDKTVYTAHPQIACHRSMTYSQAQWSGLWKQAWGELHDFLGSFFQQQQNIMNSWEYCGRDSQCCSTCLHTKTLQLSGVYHVTHGMPSLTPPKRR